MRRPEQRDLPSCRDQLALIRKVVDKVPGMLAYWDSDMRCRFANAAYEQWFGVKPESLIGHTMQELLGPIYELNLPYIRGALRGEPQSFEREIPNPSGGPARYSHAHYLPDVVDGVVQGFVVMVSDISGRRQLELQLREAHERAESLATHDFLTGLPNRILLEDRIDRAIESATRNTRHCGVLFIDLDGFKEINDSLGHAAGDIVLREAARRLSEALRAADTVARLGGDEFIVLLSDLEGRDNAQAVASKLLSALSASPFIANAQTVRLTCSIGVAVFPGDGDNMRELVAHADSALYDAKRAGKNQLAFFTRR